MISYKISKNEKYGDYRIDIYKDGIWVNQKDGGWSKYKAYKKLKEYRENN